MKELNKARHTFIEEGIIMGKNTVRSKENNFQIPCEICSKPMKFSSNNEKWDDEVKPTLLKAFEGWIHEACESEE